MPNPTIVKFPHGIGDAVHFRLVCELYRQKGHEVRVAAPADKELIFGPFFTQEQELGLDLGWWQENAGIIDAHDTWQRGNKAFAAINLTPLPHISATIEELTAIVVYIDAGADRNAPTPRPYISMHPQGGSGCYWGSKSLTTVQITTLIEALLDRTDLDIVLLEGHNAYPTFNSPRVFLEQRPPLARLANIIAHAAVHIDVDSGPLYLSRLTNTPAIGLVPNPFHHPAVFTLPRPLATYVSVPTPLSALFPDLYHVVESPMPLDMNIVADCAAKSLGQIQRVNYRTANISMLHRIYSRR